MAIVTAYRSFNMDDLASGSVSNPGTGSFSVEGNYTQNFSGSYTIVGGALDAGTTTSITVTEYYQKSDGSYGSRGVAAITGLSLDAAYSWDLADMASWSTLQEYIFSGNDTFTGSTESDLLYGYGGNDQISGGDGQDLLSGGAGNDSLSGGSGADSMVGGDGNDTLDGGTSRDSMEGGLGNDTYYVDRISDVVTELADAGTDKVFSSISLALGTNVENLALTGTLGATATGNTLNNYLSGNGAANLLQGLDGNDTLNGGNGSDTLNGGAGNDVYVIDQTGDVIVDSSGTDNVLSAIAYTLDSSLENLTLTGTAAINGIGNTANNLLSGNTANNSLTGNVGNDTINGGGGVDTLIGGTGQDLYIVDSTTDVISETTTSLGEIDTVQSSQTWTLGANLENLNLTGTASINGTGNSLANTISGNVGNNLLDGGAGTNDTVSYAYSTAAVTVNLSLTAAQGTRGAGTDTLSNFENLTGSNYNDYLIGNNTANRIDGGTGADTMYGGGGNDIYVVDNAADKVVDYQNAGTDTILASVDFDLRTTPGVENLTLTGTENLTAIGNAANTAGTGINILRGNTGDNFLSGLAGNDTLYGGAGNDSLYGGQGNDSLSGEAGNDIFYGSLGSDALTGGTGRDTFVFDSTLGSDIDTISDFNVYDDIIQLNSTVFGALTPDGSYPGEPAWTEENFRTVNGNSANPASDGASDSNDYIIYDGTSGKLYYDADGSGAGVAIQFATLSANLKLVGISAANFEVI